MKRQLATLGPSPSQEEVVLNANRHGRRLLSLKNQRKAEDLLEAKSGDEVVEITDSMEERLLVCDTADDSKISSIEDKAKDWCLDNGAEEEWDLNDFTDSQMEALNNLESSEVKKSTTQSTATIKTEPVSGEDIVFVGHFISGTYEGPRAVNKTIKQEYISPETLIEYNKSAVGDQKLVPMKEVFGNIYDVQNVYTAGELAGLLSGRHRQRYKKNIDMVEKLKKTILAVQEGTEQAEGSKCEPTTLFKCLEEERLEQEKLEIQHGEQEKLEMQHHEQEKLEAQRHEQGKLEVQHHEQEKLEMQHHEQEKLEVQHHEQEKLEAQHHEQEKLEGQHHEREKLETQCCEQEKLEAQHCEQEKLEAQHHEQEKLETQHCEQEKFEAQCHEQEKLEVQHREQEKLEAQCCEQEKLEAQHCEQEKLEVQCHEQEKLDVQCLQQEKQEAEHEEAIQTTGITGKGPGRGQSHKQVATPPSKGDGYFTPVGTRTRSTRK